VIVLIYLWGRYEGFSSRGEKANAIYKWYKGGNNTYNSYRDEIPSADIVEYHDVKKAILNGVNSADDFISTVYNY
jgi:hypothetical protein